MLQPAPQNRFEAAEMLNQSWIYKDMPNQERIEDLYRRHDFDSEINELIEELKDEMEATLVIQDSNQQRKNPRNDDDPANATQQAPKRQRVN
jgi:hypothetical protein